MSGRPIKPPLPGYTVEEWKSFSASKRNALRYPEKVAEKNRRNRAANPERAALNKRLWAQRNKDRVNQTQREWAKKNPERFEELKRKSTLRRYGITAEQYDALLVAQNKCCAICKAPAPKGDKKYFSIDHDHSSGKVRGLLCDPCNQAIGLLEDSVVSLSNAIDYLKAHSDC
jgi:hypothetical protein